VKEQEPIDSASLKPPTDAERWVNQLLIRSIRDEASEVHLEPTGEGLAVKFKVGGVLQTVVAQEKDLAAEIVSRIKVLSRISDDAKQVPRNGNYAAIVDGRKIDFRVSISPTTHGEAIVVQVLDRMRETGASL